MSTFSRRVKRIAPVVFAWFQLWRCTVGRNVATFGRVRVRGAGRIRIGSRVSITGGLVPTTLLAHEGAELVIGAGCMVNAGSHYEAHGSIEIGERCLIASSVLLVDRDSEREGPIIIEDNVWLAHGVTVRPGVRIGRNSVVSAGSTVVSDVPPDSLVVGNPGRAVPLGLAAAAKEQRR